MESILNKLKLILTDGSILQKLGFMVGGLIIFRFMSAIPLPGIDAIRLEAFFNQSQFLGFLDVFSEK